jgi:hypothetical protein
LLILGEFVEGNWKLGLIDDSINPNFRTPKAKVNFFIWHEFFQIQLAPAMQTETTK